ncbi:MAG: hypothetical protein J4N71_09855, partial [Chloroflexi bacterium]|nr:hypothetical protein [Chloroflexota bacterium]
LVVRAMNLLRRCWGWRILLDIEFVFQELECLLVAQFADDVLISEDTGKLPRIIVGKGSYPFDSNDPFAQLWIVNVMQQVRLSQGNVGEWGVLKLHNEFLCHHGRRQDLAIAYVSHPLLISENPGPFAQPI